MEFDRAQLKRDVKLSMRCTTPKPILVALLFSVVASGGTWLINTVLGRMLTGGVSSISDTVQYYMLQGYEVEYAVQTALLDLFRMGLGALFGAIVGGSVLSIIVYLWQSTIGVGFEDYCLSMVRNENPPMGRIFNVFPMFGQVFVTRVLTGVFELLWASLVFIGYAVVLVLVMTVFNDVPALAIPLVLADFVAMVLGIIWVVMRYALVDYVLLDKGLSGMDAIRESKRLMQGNIGKGFKLQLSFFGWYFLILAIIYGGIILAVVPMLTQLSDLSESGLIAASGFALLVLAVVAIAVTVLMLWLHPYTSGCWAKFYDWACGAADGFHHGPGYGGGSDGWSDHPDYTWSSGAGSGRGTGLGPGNGPSTHNPPKRRDDPWN